MGRLGGWVSWVDVGWMLGGLSRLGGCWVG